MKVFRSGVPLCAQALAWDHLRQQYTPNRFGMEGSSPVSLYGSCALPAAPPKELDAQRFLGCDELRLTPKCEMGYAPVDRLKETPPCPGFVSSPPGFAVSSSSGTWSANSTKSCARISRWRPRRTCGKG